jgi:hypothetical protein
MPVEVVSPAMIFQSTRHRPSPKNPLRHRIRTHDAHVAAVAWSSSRSSSVPLKRAHRRLRRKRCLAATF